MPILLAAVACLGAWLLVAGPIFQAALELTDQEIDRPAIHAAAASVPRERRVSAWWWLLPPVAYVLMRRRNRRYRDAVTAVLTPEQLEQWLDFSDRSTGWLYVGAGGTFIAIDETWQLVEGLRWEPWTFWLLVVVGFGASALNTATRMRRSHDLVDAAKRRAGEEPAPRVSRAARRSS